jgi:ferredoxin
MLTRQKLEDFVLFLGKNAWEIFGPKRYGGKIEIGEINNPADLKLEKELPFYSFKRFFVPEREPLFAYHGHYLKTDAVSSKKKAILGINLLDLKSILLYDQVFEKDPYYQTRRRNMLIVGHSIIPDLPQNIFEQTFEEDILEHLNFDIFLAELSSNSRPPKKRTKKIKAVEEEPEQEFAVFTGSPLGQKIMTDFGYNEYINIQFSGPVREGKPDERMQKIKDRLENKHNQKIWDELGARCIECGKCTVACPTCFCFRIDDQAELGSNQGVRSRCWDSCFYQEFSEVALGHKFLSDTAKRIHFWYFHKFARIPEEFNFMGCVGCHRCAVVCPVGIDIVEVLKDIEKS